MYTAKSAGATNLVMVVSMATSQSRHVRRDRPVRQRQRRREADQGARAFLAARDVESNQHARGGMQAKPRTVIGVDLAREQIRGRGDASRVVEHRGVDTPQDGPPVF